MFSVYTEWNPRLMHLVCYTDARTCYIPLRDFTLKVQLVSMRLLFCFIAKLIGFSFSAMKHPHSQFMLCQFNLRFCKYCPPIRMASQSVACFKHGTSNIMRWECLHRRSGHMKTPLCVDDFNWPVHSPTSVLRSVFVRLFWIESWRTLEHRL